MLVCLTHGHTHNTQTPPPTDINALARPSSHHPQVFSLFDDDGTGGISFRNLKRVANELGENLTDEELQEMIGR